MMNSINGKIEKMEDKDEEVNSDMPNSPSPAENYNQSTPLLGKKNRFETYVKAKDLDLWHIILNGDFPPVAKNEVTQILEEVPFEQQDDNLKRKLAKNNEAKMVLYNALPKKEYERIFMCKTAKDIWQSLLITHQGNSQVKDNKIDLLVQQYEQFTILEEESIDSGFARFNTIITSLKALDEESKDNITALDDLIGNLKVHEVVMEKDSEIYKGKKERVKSIALKAKKESSDDETSTFGSDDEEYVMAVRNFKKFFRRRVNLLGNQDKKRSHSDKGMRSENDVEDKSNDETCLMAQSSNEFLKTKNEAFAKFEILSRKIQNQLGSSIVAIRTDHGREFDNEIQFGAYCDAQGITHNFSTPRTPQSNGVVERNNRTLQEMFRTMLNEQSIPQKFWCNAVDTSTYILNRILNRPILGKTPYEIFRESLNVTFDESPPPTKLSPLVDDDVGEEEAIKNNTKVVNNSKEEDESIEADEVVNIKESKNHPLEQVIEPKDVNEALRDEC
ncbi:zf-CCHC domain-containing protein [Tanacetum coccineum]